MPSEELLFQLYKKFYEQRAVLKGAPNLTLDIEKLNVDTLDKNLADTELTALISYMMGTKDVKKLSWDDALALVEKYYSNQPQWQKLLLDYFSYNLEKEKENIMSQQSAFFQDILKQLDTNKETKSE